MKRWSVDTWSHDDKDGDYILYTDYAALKARVAELEGERQAFFAGGDQLASIIQERDTLRAQLEAAKAPPKEGIVKPVFWNCPNSIVNGGHGLHAPGECPKECYINKPSQLVKDTPAPAKEWPTPLMREAAAYPSYTAPTPGDLLDALYGMVWQFGFACGPDNSCINDGGMSYLETAIPILEEAGLLERYKGRPEMEWYCAPSTNAALAATHKEGLDE